VKVNFRCFLRQAENRRGGPTETIPISNYEGTQHKTYFNIIILKTVRLKVKTYEYVSFFSTAFVRNLFRSDKELTGGTCKYSCEVSSVFVQFERNFEFIEKCS
jgi:hypothetical protein